MVFVTGGTGFIGTKLVTELVQKGHIIHVLRRPTSNTEGLEHERIHLFTGDLMDGESLRKAMEGCTQVYHLAAYAKNWAEDSKNLLSEQRGRTLQFVGNGKGVGRGTSSVYFLHCHLWANRVC